MHSRFSVALLVSVVAASCGPAESNVTELRAPSAQGTDALAAYPGFHRWGNQVTTCYANRRNVDAATFIAGKASTFSALQAAWDAHSALSFSLGADCSATGPIASGTIRIVLDADFFGGNCGGNGITGDCVVEANNLSVIGRIAVHEVGHALGFA